MPGPAEVAHGPMFIGFTFNVFLFGIMITQVYLYFTTYKNDKRWMKIFVVILVIADTANTIFDAAYLYRSLIVHFGDVNMLLTADWLFATDPAITGIIAALVQLFFAWRVRILTHSWSLAVVVLLGSLSGIAGAVATSFEVGDTPRFTDFRDFKGVVIVWLVSESVTDIIITTSLVWYLDGIRRGLGSRIIWLTGLYATGLITSVVATLDLILFLVYANGTHLIFNFPLCKLYTNSLMSSLNARAGWRYGASARGTGTASDLLHHSVPASELLKDSAPASEVKDHSAPASVVEATAAGPRGVMAGVGGGVPVLGTLLEQRGRAGAGRWEEARSGGAVEAGGKADSGGKTEDGDGASGGKVGVEDIMREVDLDLDLGLRAEEARAGVVSPSRMV